jgi:hypothetical protein
MIMPRRFPLPSTALLSAIGRTRRGEAMGPTGTLPVICQTPHIHIPIERQPRINVEPTQGVTPANCIANPLM